MILSHVHMMSVNNAWSSANQMTTAEESLQTALNETGLLAFQKQRGQYDGVWTKIVFSWTVLYTDAAIPRTMDILSIGSWEDPIFSFIIAHTYNNNVQKYYS